MRRSSRISPTSTKLLSPCGTIRTAFPVRSGVSRGEPGDAGEDRFKVASGDDGFPRDALALRRGHDDVDDVLARSDRDRLDPHVLAVGKLRAVERDGGPRTVGDHDSSREIDRDVQCGQAASSRSRRVCLGMRGCRTKDRQQREECRGAPEHFATYASSRRSSRAPQDWT
jgi:hypothetical protein